MSGKTFLKVPSGDQVLDRVQDRLGHLADNHQASLTTTAKLLANGLTFGTNFNAEFLTVSITTPTSAWTALTLLNSWVATNNTPRYRKDANGVVWLEARVSTGTTATSQVALLPVGFRPGNQMLYGTRGPGVWSSFSVGSDGVVVPIENSANTDISLNCSFSCTDLSPAVLSCFPLLLSPTRVTSPAAVLVANILDTSTSPSVVALGQPTFRVTAGRLYLTNLPGLLLGRTYTVTLLLVGG